MSDETPSTFDATSMDARQANAGINITQGPAPQETRTGSSTPKTMGRQSIKVKHNMEMAHRLSLTSGKCEAIHGHSWWAELEIVGEVDSKGMLLEFGYVKQAYRKFLDIQFDHRLLLNQSDSWLVHQSHVPGLVKCKGDPTTENVARWIGEWAISEFGIRHDYNVTVWETSVNCATWSYVTPQ